MAKKKASTISRVKRQCYKNGDKYRFIIASKSKGETVVFEWEKRLTTSDKQTLKKILVDHQNELVRISRGFIFGAVYPKNGIDKRYVIDLEKVFSDAPFVETDSKQIGTKEDDKFRVADRIPFVMPKENKLVMSAINRGRNIMLVGPSGCGKSKMIIELAKRNGAKLYRTNVNAGTTDASLIGEKSLDIDKVTGKTITAFTYGIVPKAMKEGTWLLIDEIDFMQPEYLASLQAILEGDGTPLVINENGGEVIYPHSNFRLLATANTLGRGDTNGYHGTNILNIASLDRWAIFKMDYYGKEHELISQIVGEEIAQSMMLVVNRVRESIKQGNLPDMVLSTRRLLHWAEAMNDASLSFKEATELELLGRLTPEERKIIGEYIKDAFGSAKGKE